MNKFYYELPVQRLWVGEINDPEEVQSEYARAALELLSKAYARQFEEPRGDQPAGIFTKRFDANDNIQISRQEEHMKEHIAEGSRYFFIPEGAWTASDGSRDDLSVWRGLAKTSPSRATRLQKMRIGSPNCYLNDIAVAPLWQYRGYGRALLHAAISHSGFERDNTLVLDAFKANEDSVNEWFRQLGLHTVKATVEPFIIDASHELPQIRYSSEGAATLGGIAHLLERKKRVVPNWSEDL
jgi:GNAT superfamily N-acetyltransferase